MTNCPNCGSPIEPYKYKCDYCGTWYFDFTAFDMSDNKPYYVKFCTPSGAIITTLARPELQTINLWDDTVGITDVRGNLVKTITASRNCDLEVTFHSIMNPDNNTLFTFEVNDEKLWDCK